LWEAVVRFNLRICWQAARALVRSCKQYQLRRVVVAMRVSGPRRTLGQGGDELEIPFPQPPPTEIAGSSVLQAKTAPSISAFFAERVGASTV
jgi:hypothetical protein